MTIIIIIILLVLILIIIIIIVVIMIIMMIPWSRAGRTRGAAAPRSALGARRWRGGCRGGLIITNKK